MRDLLVTEREGKRLIWVAVDHPEWGTSFVAAVDPVTGVGTVRDVNTGSLESLNEITTSLGTFLLAGGFNDEYDSPSLAVFDEGKPYGTSPQTGGSRYECLNCAKGGPDLYFAFPRSEMSRVRKRHEDAVRAIRLASGEFEAAVFTRFENDDDRRIYLFQSEPDIHPVTLLFSSTYDSLHRDFERNGLLFHPIQDCPERLFASPVRMWNPAGGWRTLSVGPIGADQ